MNFIAPITLFYASILSFLYLYLTINVIKHRRSKKISLMDGNDKTMAYAIRAHSNFIEYTPLSLIFMFIFEVNQINTIILHIFGIIVVISRVLHAQGMIKKEMNKRVMGMRLTVSILFLFGLIGFFIFIYSVSSKLF